jgi:DsbC/DsbD-like thiol-disulfide interchange protein
MKATFSILSLVFFSWIYGQSSPVTFTAYAANDTLVFDAAIEKGWHLYAAHLPNPYEGPLPTEFIFNASSDFQLNGVVIEPSGITEMDNAFGIEVKYYTNTTSFKQPIKRINEQPFTCLGTINYMVCNDQMCIPLDYSFTIPMK